MTDRRHCLTLLGCAALAAARARAAGPPPGRRRLGVLLFDEERSWAWMGPELRQALAGLGWVEGSNLSIEWRFADGDPERLAPLAAALVGSGVDAILTRGSPATRALQRATRSVPIVTGVGDPIGSGFAETLARPGGNITGVSYAVVETTRKQLELLREMVPGLARLTIVRKGDRRSPAIEATRVVEAEARAQAITTRVVMMSHAEDLSRELPGMPGKGVHAAYVFGFGMDPDPKAVAAALIRARLPAVFSQREYVEAGGQMSYRLDWDDQTQRTAAQIDKVLRGESPAQIPFEFPTRSDFVVNARTAKALGLIIPPALRVRADEVIE